MKSIKIAGFLFLAFLLNLNCSSGTASNTATTSVTEVDGVEVYYFHFTRRCATCNAVETISKQALAELYGDKVSFTSYNLDEETGKQKGEELKVSGQTLLIVAGDTHINITTEGFMNARNNPDKLKAIIKEKIDPFI